MKAIRRGSIGVFDSGFGGLTILRSLVKRLPQYSYRYLGDTARAPYGSRSKEVIYEFTRQAVDELFARGCELVILACNTASSDALRRIQREYLPKQYPNRRVLGVLIPAAEEAVKKTTGNKIGVLATEATVTSEAFVRELTKLDPDIQVVQQACPMLVPLIETGEERSRAMSDFLEKYLRPLKRKRIDTLILGCTHYGIVESAIRRMVGPGVSIISEANVVPKRLEEYLRRHPEIETTLAKRGRVTFYSTDLTDRFARLGARFFGKPITVRSIRLHE